MKKKYIAVMMMVVLLTNIAAVSAKSGVLPSDGKQLFHNRFYVRYSHGLSIYLNDVKGGYPGLSDKEIRIGMTLEPEGGVIIKDAVELGISYLYMDGIAEYDGGTLGLFYDDAFFSGVAFKGRWHVDNSKHTKISIGIEAVVGDCMLFSGVTDDRNKIRGISQEYSALFNSYNYFEGTGYGGGISGSYVYQPFKFLSLGVDALFRVIISERLEESKSLSMIFTEMIINSLNENYDAEKYEHIRMNFTSLNLNAFIAFHF